MAGGEWAEENSWLQKAPQCSYQFPQPNEARDRPTKKKVEVITGREKLHGTPKIKTTKYLIEDYCTALEATTCH